MTIKDQVRRAVINALQADLDGDELLTKEVFENCADADETAEVEKELKALIKTIGDRLGLP